MNPVVYVIVNLINGKVYVGKANNARRRWNNHRSSARSTHPRSAIAGAIKKYGASSFRFQVLEEHSTEEGALLGESWWISFLGSDVHGKGYNLDGGGHGGKTLSEGTRQKISAALKGRKQNPEAIAKSAATRRGMTPSLEAIERRSASNRGQCRTPEQCARISEGKRGQTYTDEQRAKMSVSHLGHHPGANTRMKMSEAHRGKKKSPETRARMSVARRARTQGVA